MPLSLRFRDKQLGAKFRFLMQDKSRKTQRAARGAMRDVIERVLREGRADIASAGNFGRRWTSGFKGNLVEQGDSVIAQFSHDVSYFMTHQKGALIRGKPLLWIPLSHASDAQGVMARDYPGGLFRVDRKGSKAPLLLSVRDGEPKYFGKTQVRIPKRFHVLEIIKEYAGKIGQFVQKRMKD